MNPTDSFIGNMMTTIWGIQGAQWAQTWNSTPVGGVVNSLEQAVGVPIATAAGLLGLILIFK